MYFRWSSLVFRGLGGTANKLKRTYEGSRLGLVGSRLIDFATFMIVFFSERFYRVSDVAVFMVLIDIGTTLDCSSGLYCWYAAFVVLSLYSFGTWKSLTSLSICFVC